MNYLNLKKSIAIILVCAFIALMLPIVITAFYSVPVFDDYTFGRDAHRAVSEGESFWIGVFHSCERFYNTWQGFYTSNLYASMQPYNVNVDYYFISNLTVIGLIIISFICFFKVILRDYLKMERADYIIIATLLLITFVEFMPSLAEGIYWMDGSLALAINCLQILAFACVIKYELTKEKKYSMLATILILGISGSGVLSFVTLFMVLCSAIYFSSIKKIKAPKLMIFLFVLYAIGMTIAILAPGNQVRKAEVVGLGLIQSIALAIYYAIVYLGKWLSLSVLAVLGVISWIVFPYVQKSKMKFDCPVQFSVMCFGIYSARMSVQFYAAGYLGAPRQMNQYYLGFLICIVLWAIYMTGWLSKQHFSLHIEMKKKKKFFLALVCCFSMFVIGCFGYGLENMASGCTALGLIRGRTQQYNLEMRRRIVMYEDDELRDIEVEPLSYYPKFFMRESVSENKDDWANRAIAAYYNKNSVQLVEASNND